MRGHWVTVACTKEDGPSESWVCPGLCPLIHPPWAPPVPCGMGMLPALTVPERHSQQVPSPHPSSTNRFTTLPLSLN